MRKVEINNPIMDLVANVANVDQWTVILLSVSHKFPIMYDTVLLDQCYVSAPLV